MFERYNLLLQAVLEYNQIPKVETTDASTNTFNNELLSEVARKTLLVQELGAKLVETAKSFDFDGANKVAVMDRYLKDVISLHLLLARLAVIIWEVLNPVRRARERINEKGNSDAPDFRETYKSGRKRSVRTVFPSTALDFDAEDMQILIEKRDSHHQFVAHAQRWYSEILNAATDGASLEELTSLFEVETDATFLEPASPDTTEKSQDWIREQAVKYYDCLLTQEEIEHERKVADNLEEFGAEVRSDDGESDDEDEIDEDKYCRPINLFYDMIWCHVTKDYWAVDYIKAVALIPAHTATETIRSGFGVTDSEVLLSHPRNILFLHHSIAYALNSGKIAIVSSPGPRDLSLLIIDQDLILNDQCAVSIMTGQDISWRELLADPILEFKNNRRPGNRNLFWNCLTGFQTAKSACYRGLEDALDQFKDGKIWKDTGKWIEKEVLRCLSRNWSLPEIYREAATFEKSIETKELERDILMAALGFPVPPANSYSQFTPEQSYLPAGLLPIDSYSLQRVLKLTQHEPS